MMNLRLKIEKLKELLELKLMENGYTSNDEIVKISQELDKYIVKYQRMIQNKKAV